MSEFPVTRKTLASNLSGSYKMGHMSGLRTLAFLTLSAHPLLAGVVLDGSFGTSGSLPGPNFMIQASFGKQVGGNLFQSFSQFNLNSSQSATFLGPSNVQNILARVTGGSPSSIDGMVRSNIAGANLFFMNPAGVLFGANAQLDVSGSVAVTTANYLNLVGGGRFNANLGGGDVLTSAPVSAFGFLNNAPASVSVTGSTLNVASQKVFSAVGGDITLSGSQIVGESSRVNLVSVKSPGEAQLDATNLNSSIDVTQFTTMGTIRLSNLARINTSGPGGGPISIVGGNLNIDSGQITSDTMGSSPGDDLTITVDELLSIMGPESKISSDTHSSGKGGSICIHAGSLSIDGLGAPDFEAGILARSDASGDAGNLSITVDKHLSIVGGGLISAATFSNGNGGDVNVHARSISIDGSASDHGTGITADTQGNGDAGDATITVDKLLSVVSAGIISARTFSNGNGGNLTIHAGSLLIDGSVRPGETGIFVLSDSGLPDATGDAGNLALTVDGALSIVGGGFISATTNTRGKGGDVTIHAESLSIDGSAAPDNFTGIEADANAIGDAGNVTIRVDKALSIVGSVNAGITAPTFSSGNGGSIDIHAGSLLIDGSAQIFAKSTGSGKAGNISIRTAGPIDLKHGGQITTRSSITDAGFIHIISGGKIKLKGQSQITVSAGHNGGDIHITTPDLVYLLNSSITATAGPSGDRGAGGNITIDPTFIVLNNSLINANAAAGQGGNINLVSDFFFNSNLSNNNITATGTTNGTVNITAPALDLGAQLITLPSSLLSAESQLQERCAALLRGDFSSFISVGRGGTEPAPEELQTTF